MSQLQYLGTLPLYPRSKYVAELRSALPDGALEPARSRALLVPLYLGVIAAAIVAVARGWIPWPIVPVVSVIIGATFACLTFVAHEALHGGIVRDKVRQQLIGWLGFLPFTLSPRLWVAWHNRSHHGHTQLPEDPDSYATLARYRARRSTRFSVDAFSLGGRRWRGLLSLALGFTVQSADQLVSARARGFLSPREFAFALAETAAGVAVWLAVALYVGPLAFLFVYVLPLLIGNACVMAFILTNHSLSPRIAINDPLISGLSVTTPRVIDRLTLRFGYHVEHHLFPAMSSRHAPAIRALVQDRWPERYQSMSLVAALRALHNTARVYKDDTTLFDPLTGAEFSTLLPGHPKVVQIAPEYVAVAPEGEAA
jgi:fatty acid desaturase